MRIPAVSREIMPQSRTSIPRSEVAAESQGIPAGASRLRERSRNQEEKRQGPAGVHQVAPEDPRNKSSHSLSFADQLGRLDLLLQQSSLERVWPEPHKKLGWKESLQRLGARGEKLADDLLGHALAAKALLQLSQQPIVAVLGQLNAGKSSVVASFLSRESQRLVPTGTRGDKGTHRFVYWLPASWRDDERINAAFLDLLRSAHGDGIEYLASDPGHAAEQYRSGLHNLQVLNCPLVAFDKKLDEEGFALLDCPDVQTKDDVESRSTDAGNPRIAFAAKAASLCSSFLVVWDAANVRDALFGTLLQAVRKESPNVRVSVLINKIRPSHDEPTQTRDEVLAGEHAWLGDTHNLNVYAAFDFNVDARTDFHGVDRPGWKQRTPSPLVERYHTAAGPFPQFFEVDPSHDNNNPDAVESSRFLHVRLAKVEPGELQRKKLSWARSQVCRTVRKSTSALRSYVRAQEKNAQDIQKDLLKFVHEEVFTSTDGAPTLCGSEEWARDFEKATLRAMPPVIREALQAKEQIGHLRRIIRDAAADLVRRAMVLARAKAFVSRLRKKLRGEKRVAGSWKGVSDFELARKFCQTRVGASCDVEKATSVFRNVNKELQKKPPKISAEQMECLARQLWDGLERGRKAWAYVGAILSLLGSVVALFAVPAVIVDGGVTYIGAFSVATAIKTSVLGPLAMFGWLAAAKGALLIEAVVKHMTVPALSQYFAHVCDSLGVPRPSDFTKLSVLYRPAGGKETLYHLPDTSCSRLRGVYAVGDFSQFRLTQTVRRLREWGAANG